MLLLNNAEAQASGTTVTPDNSGGPDADAFDAVVIGANMTNTFDNAHPAHGVCGYKFALASTATAATYLEWYAAIGAARVTLFGGFYFYSNRVPATSTIRFLQFLKDATVVGYLGVDQSGLSSPQFRSSADAAIGTAGFVMSANTLYRVEWTVTCGASGSGTVKVFLGNGTTPQGTDGAFSAVSFGTDINKFRIGFTTANFSSTSGDFAIIDDINLNSTGYPGPGSYSKGGVFLPRRNPILEMLRVPG